MAGCGHSHALRAVLLACGMAWFGPATVSAETLCRRPPCDRSAEPFGLSASALSVGGLREKWLGLERRLDDERVQLALCDGDRERCASPAALQFLAIVDTARTREGRARLGEINRAINLAIRPMSDLAQYGEDRCLEFAAGNLRQRRRRLRGLCDRKFVGLAPRRHRTGRPAIVIMHDTVRDEDHAVAAARLDGHWLMLDNRRMAMVEDADVRNYRPTFVIDQRGVMQYVDAPLLASLPGHDPAPSQRTRPPSPV